MCHRPPPPALPADKTKHEFVPWSEIVPELTFDSKEQSMGTVTVPTAETVAIGFWLDPTSTNSTKVPFAAAVGARLQQPASFGQDAVLFLSF